MPVPGDWVLTCPYCSASPAPFIPQDAFSTTGREGNEMRWQAASCPACGCVVVARLHVRSNAWRVHRTYPRAVGKWEVEHLPPSVAPSWDEAIAVFRTNALASAVVMCGRTLEAAADARGVSKGTLQRRVHDMLQQGLITAEFKDAMTYTRMMRNVGAHAGQTVSPKSAEGAMNFTQQTLRMLFEVPAQLALLTEPTPEELEGDDEEQA